MLYTADDTVWDHEGEEGKNGTYTLNCVFEVLPTSTKDKTDNKSISSVNWDSTQASFYIITCICMYEYVDEHVDECFYGAFYVRVSPVSDGVVWVVC